ncbi:sensor histidine kinase [Minicystis rosea]|nr:sensor histidine kinase [Minicystis rosea]
MIGPLRPRSPARLRLGARIATGVAIGILYAMTDAYLDRLLVNGTLARSRFLLFGHEIVYSALPIVTGAILGAATHFLRLRAEIAEAERRRADELHDRIHKITRDQAVWVVAASLLHELRTPLHALGLLLDEVTALPEGEAAERAALLDRARVQSDRLIEQVAALKQLPDTRRPDLPDIDLLDVARRAVADLQGLARGAPVHLAVHGEAGTTARASAAYVQIILENLVENSLDALREGDAAGAVEVEIGREGDRAFVRVRDDGPGIEPDVAAQLFEPLRSTKARGLGLGLSIARALARAMQGELQLERAHPATFRLDLQRGGA